MHRYNNNYDTRTMRNIIYIDRSPRTLIYTNEKNTIEKIKMMTAIYVWNEKRHKIKRNNK